MQISERQRPASACLMYSFWRKSSANWKPYVRPVRHYELCPLRSRSTVRRYFRLHRHQTTQCGRCEAGVCFCRVAAENVVDCKVSGCRLWWLLASKRARRPFVQVRRQRQARRLTDWARRCARWSQQGFQMESTVQPMHVCGRYTTIRLNEIVQLMMFMMMIVEYFLLWRICGICRRTERFLLISPPPPPIVAVFEHVSATVGQCPIISFPGISFSSWNFAEAVVERQVVTNRVLPTLLVLSVVGKIVHDELIDAIQSNLPFRCLSNSHSDECNVWIGRFSWSVAVCHSNCSRQHRQSSSCLSFFITILTPFQLHL